MNKLIIDTANEKLLIALKIGDQVFSISSDTKSKHNEAMIPLVDEILGKHGLDIKDINELGVVIGPGSFTGIRVGIATIKAFRDGLGIKAKGINNLDYLYAIANKCDSSIETVAIKGSRNSYFVARLIRGVLYKYERNLTLDELNTLSNGGKVGMFTLDEDVNCFVVESDPIILSECAECANEDLVPVYYQLSQAENEKLKKGTLLIEKAKPEDVEDIYNIEKSSIQYNTLSMQDVEKGVGGNYSTFVARFEGEIVGFIMLEITDEVNITSVAVDNNYRNLGIATKLIETAMGYTRECGLKTISLEVSDRNLTAYVLYEKLGFKVRRERKKYYADQSNALEMYFEVSLD